MTVRELNREQYKELCQRYITEFWTDDAHGTSSPSLGELACADELVDENVIYNYYEGVNFVEEDFFCSKGNKYVLFRKRKKEKSGRIVR